MYVKGLAVVAAAFFLCVTGCHVGPGAHGCGPGGGCGGLVGLLPGGSDCSSGACTTPETLRQDGFAARGGLVGPLADHFGRHHRGAQSHLGAYPGPADGPPTPTVTYPYYTTRGPRDFLRDDPPSIGP